jgi:hypothetical protein
MASTANTAPHSDETTGTVSPQVKRHMAAATKIEGYLKVEGTPYVVLSLDGPVDVNRLLTGLGMQSHSEAAQTLLTAATPEQEGFVTTLPEPPGRQAHPDDDGFELEIEDDGEDEDDDAPGEDIADDIDPETKILTYLTAHGPSDAKSIGPATGVTGTMLGATLVTLMNQGRIVKNGLAYAAIGHTG